MMRFYDRLIYGLAVFSGLLIATVCGLIVWDVTARNLGLQPPASTLALTEYALLYFTMAAAPWLVRQRAHIVVEVLYQRFPPALRRYLDRLIVFSCAAICALVAVLAVVLMAEAFRRGELDVRSLDTPRWLLFLPLAVGFALMSVEFLRLLLLGETLCSAEAEHHEAL